MCGIIGIFDNDKAVVKVVSGLSVVSDRGKDGAGLYVGGKVYHAKFLAGFSRKVAGRKGVDVLGHVLHSIVGVVTQPLVGKYGTLVANCEIYNWKELDAKYKLNAKNDSDMLLKLLDKKGIGKFKYVLDELDGVYAFAYWRGDRVYVCRDIVGVKPVWYCDDGFCSERKALESVGFGEIKELNPREILVYELNVRKLKLFPRRFEFSIKPQNRKSKDAIKKELEGLLVNAVAKRIPDKKFGILFSGGVDSTFIALLCKKLGVDFTLYTAALDEPRMKVAEDLEWSIKIAKKLGLKLKVKKLKLSQVEKYLKKVVPLIEDNNVVKVGVGLTFYVACELAKKDGIKVIFSGLGSEELFAGYERHLESHDVNNECLSGILKIYERDLYRDDVVSMNNNLELRLPFLDKKLVDYSLKIPERFKLDDVQNKKIFREIAEEMGLDAVFAQRKKKAAQYGSKFDKAIGKLANKKGFKLKSDYLREFYNRGNPRLGVMFSGGKDSALALHVMKKQNYPIGCLISMKSVNPDSYMFHTPNIDLVELQGKAMGLPVVMVETKGEKEKELKDLEKAIRFAKKKYKIEGVVTGALYSQYQRSRVEKICDKLGLKIFSPLWHMNQEKEMKMLVKEGFEFVMSSVAAQGLDKSWLGRSIGSAEIAKLVKLHDKIGFHVAGEGGEFESLVLDSPDFKKRVELGKVEFKEESDIVARMIVKSAKLRKK